MGKQMTPFSNGTEFMVWHGNNCDRCQLYENESTMPEEAKCEAAFYIDLGVLTGEIPVSILEKISNSESIEPVCKIRQI